jgi:hypothetical protein
MYKVYKFQNTSNFSGEKPSIEIDDGHSNLESTLKNWIQGKNPTDDPKWKVGVFAIFKLIKNFEKI